MAPFFAMHQNDAPTFSMPEALVSEAGSNVWMKYDTWPPKAAVSPRALHMREGGALVWSPPTGESVTPYYAYVSDPAKPVPYRQRPVQMTYGPGPTWSTWLTEDQRFVHNRPDVMSWELPTLTEDLTIAGDLTVTLHASTSRRSTHTGVEDRTAGGDGNSTVMPSHRRTRHRYTNSARTTSLLADALQQ